ncbi:Palmitoyl protein thioesterase [Metarhizium album ARSEF 1941]|uniref:Palmitoyl-protein thioesterase 1 n=1 Tax=Metarhizium album (strain ARSEF 1941) TaxID=1081103 RepID=A0A0B2WWI5_METAS|nr:Palmitoyl protein thioesterase [Metarhizium album ARSEF 1941]KHN98428.1 Palmitoyl protein thioesterase [Metarhizium album ARSEF 1941]
MRTASLLTTTAILGSSLAATAPAPPQNTNSQRPRLSYEDSDNPLPLVIWHGLGDATDSKSLAQVTQLAGTIAPGIFVHIINPTRDGTNDRTATFFGNVSEQVQRVCDQLAAHPILSTAPAIDAIGFSQGGQFLRGYVERCNFPPVRNLITFGSQHGGITDFKECGSVDYICKAAMALLRFNVWSSFVQSRVVPAQYYRPVEDEGYNMYLENSNYLADINNERELKNEAYKENLATLSKFVMFLFENDTVSIPKESSWFGEVQVNGRYMPLRERRLYKEDWLGLKVLDSKGALSFRTIKGEHMQIPEQVLNDTMAEFLGPFNKTAVSAGGDASQEL